MKTLACKDVAGIQCNFVAKGNTDKEVKDRLMGHGMTAHAEMMNNMSREQKDAMMEKMQSAIKDV
jgi:predicted small metal-binding protein